MINIKTPGQKTLFHSATVIWWQKYSSFGFIQESFKVCCQTRWGRHEERRPNDLPSQKCDKIVLSPNANKFYLTSNHRTAPDGRKFKLFINITLQHHEILGTCTSKKNKIKKKCNPANSTKCLLYIKKRNILRWRGNFIRQHITELHTCDTRNTGRTVDYKDIHALKLKATDSSLLGRILNVASWHRQALEPPRPVYLPAISGFLSTTMTESPRRNIFEM